ncbi:ubiquitin-conjugating enzyme E2 (UB2E2) [Vairimorpha necatrix]|uniref:Ubiquitin-conjugating enzyme E2 (UB2E2) n=1 Tax=Vairimorpha necatrix TaxID=6039 RepID=A0AAX4JE61_9MICR
MASGNKNKRLLAEARNMSLEPPPGCSAGPKNPDELDKWVAFIMGPPGSAYEGGMFELEITFPPDYPFKPPKVYFNTKIYHCNIFNREICLDILKNEWSPALTIDKVLLSLIALLQDQNPDDPLFREAADLYKMNRQEFTRKAREWTRLYAETQ